MVQITRRQIILWFCKSLELVPSAKIGLSKIFFVKNHQILLRKVSVENKSLWPHFLLKTFFDIFNFNTTLSLRLCPVLGICIYWNISTWLKSNTFQPKQFKQLLKQLDSSNFGILSFQESQTDKEPGLTSFQGKQVPWAVKDPSLAFSDRIVHNGSLISNCTAFV